MLTGIEIVGVVLAVIPLCIAALEHHEAELRPFRALFTYQKDLQERIDDLVSILSDFDQTIAELFEAAGVAEKHDLDAKVQAFSADCWKNKSLELKLIEYLGQKVYNGGYKIRVQNILDTVTSVAKTLGLDISENPNSAAVWRSLTQARNGGKQYLVPTSSSAPSSSPSKLKELRARVTYILQSGRLGPKLESLEKNVQRLATVVEKARNSIFMVAPPKKDALKFSTPLHIVGQRAAMLYRTLGAICRCSTHTIHCLNLQLDCRIADRSIGDAEKTCFEIAIAPAPDSYEWHLLIVDVEQDVAVRAGSRVAFADEERSSASSEWRQLEGDLCAALHHRVATEACTAFKVDATNRLMERSVARGAALKRLRCDERTSIKRLLYSLQDSQFGPTAFTSKQALMLSLTVASSFLQLYSTPWLRDDVSTEDIVFLRAAESVETSPAFVSLVIRRPEQGSGSQTPVAKSDERALLGLAVILLEICLRRTIEGCGLCEKQSPTKDMDLFDVVGRYFRAGELKAEFPCFHEAIEFCLWSWFARRNTNLSDQTTFQEIATKVVHPFHRDLEAYQKRGPAMNLPTWGRD